MCNGCFIDDEKYTSVARTLRLLETHSTAHSVCTKMNEEKTSEARIVEQRNIGPS